MQAAYIVSQARDLRLGIHAFRVGDTISHDRLVELAGSDRGIGRMVARRSLTLIQVPDDFEFSEGYPISLPSPGSMPVLEPPTQEPGDGNHTEEHDGEASDGVPTGAGAEAIDSTTTETGGEDPDGPQVQAQGELNEDVFDPEVHTIPEVQSFVNEHPDLVQDVLTAEASGRNRKTLIEWLDHYGS